MGSTFKIRSAAFSEGSQVRCSMPLVLFSSQYLFDATSHQFTLVRSTDKMKFGTIFTFAAVLASAVFGSAADSGETVSSLSIVHCRRSIAARLIIDKQLLSIPLYFASLYLHCSCSPCFPCLPQNRLRGRVVDSLGDGRRTKGKAMNVNGE
jgi:hypothetical protein